MSRADFLFVLPFLHLVLCTQLPSREEIEAQTKKTQEALNVLVNGKVAAAQQTAIHKTSAEPTFIRYF